MFFPTLTWLFSFYFLAHWVKLCWWAWLDHWFRDVTWNKTFEQYGVSNIAISFHGCQLHPIIGYQGFGKSKLTYNIFPNEKDHFIGDYVYQCLNLYSFDEVVNKYQEKLFVTYDLRKKPKIYVSLIRRKAKRRL